MQKLFLITITKIGTSCAHIRFAVEVKICVIINYNIWWDVTPHWHARINLSRASSLLSSNLRGEEENKKFSF
jgi:hypothetical protein